MVDIILKRAKQLFKSAKGLYERGDFYGVAGLSYQAFECAIIALNRKTDRDIPSHKYRMQKAKEKITLFKDKLNFLWEARNIDFYGNVDPKDPQKELQKEEIKECLDMVEKIIKNVETLLEELD